MELAQDKIDLIEKIIKSDIYPTTSDRKFANNEDLYDDFFNETCKRSLLIVKTVTSDVTLEAYLKKIATTSILNVLKSEGRLRRSKSGYMSSNTVPLESIVESSLPDYSKIDINYNAVTIQETPEDYAVKKEILQLIVNTVYEIDEQDPSKNYLKLYDLRYEKGMTQKEIAEELSLSQSEVSKRLFKLMEKVKQTFN